jgi:hypothetical protein
MAQMKMHIGGRERVLMFNWYALTTYEKTLFELVQDWNDENDVRVSAAYSTIFAGLNGAARAMQTGEVITLPDVINWVDELMVEEQKQGLIEADALFAETTLYKKWMEKQQERATAVVKELEQSLEKKSKPSTKTTTISKKHGAGKSAGH